MNAPDSTLFAIDLGNSFVRVARRDPWGSVETVANDVAERATPVAILFDAGRVIVGRMAWEHSQLDADHVALGFRNRLGDPTYRFEADGVSYSAVELVALVLRSVSQTAEAACGEPIRNVVLACPAWFDESQRQGLVDAARIAGLSVNRLISQPEAIAAAVGLQDEGQAALVVDLGGTSLDVSVVERERGAFRTRLVRGDRRLGGRDWDDLVVRWMRDEFQKRTGTATDPLEAPEALQKWRLCAEHAKIALSRRTEVSIACSHAGERARLTLSRDQFEDLAQPLLEQATAVACDAFQEWTRAGASIDQIVLAGGGAAMPAVAHRLSAALGRDVEVASDLDEATVCGAARWASEERFPTTDLCAKPVEPEPAATPAEDAIAEQFAFHKSIEPSVSMQTKPPPTPATAANDDEPVDSIERRTPAAAGEAGAADHSTANGQSASAPAATGTREDDVEFTVYGPRVVQPQRWHTLLAFAHRHELADDAPPDEPDPVAEVRRQAEQALGDRVEQYRSSTQEGRLAVPRAGELTMALYLPGFECNPPRQSFLWQESVHRCEFRVRAGAHLDGQTATGSLSVFLGSILLAEVTIRIRVDSTHVADANQNGQEASRARAYRKVFASYSHRDLVIVEQFERLHRATGDSFLRDWNELRAGEVWNERLREMIREADVFQLFWSRHAMQSRFVREEYEFALSLNRPAFIRPCYWEDPFPETPTGELPPPTLRRFHFYKLDLGGDPSPAPPPAPPEKPPAGSHGRSVASSVSRAVRAASGALGSLIPRRRADRIDERLSELTGRSLPRHDQALVTREVASAPTGVASRLLRGAGLEGRRAKGIFRAVCLASAVAAGVGGGILSSGAPWGLGVAISLVAAVGGAVVPWMYLIWRRALRRREMRRFVRDATPLLLVCLRNGLGLAGALHRVIDELEATCPGAAAEWRRTSLQMMLGCAPADALRDLAERSDADEASRLARGLRYAQLFGEPVERVLDTMAGARGFSNSESHAIPPSSP